jgi:hypothetical protein
MAFSHLVQAKVERHWGRNAEIGKGITYAFQYVPWAQILRLSAPPDAKGKCEESRRLSANRK